MNGRVIAFVISSSLVMFGAMLLQNAFNPQPAAPVEIADQDAVPNAAPTADAGNQAQASDAEQLADPTQSAASNDLKLADESDSEQALDPVKPNEDETKPDDQADEKPATQPAATKFLTIGSLAADSQHRYLITINQLGGTVRRVELNYREPKSKRLTYRDLENNGGYLGCLDCVDTKAGCLVRTVGDGTPAAEASAPGTDGGIRVGDVLVAMNAEPILDAEELNLRLEKKTRPGQTVTVKVDREGKQIDFTVQLIDKPIELLRPEKSPDNTDLSLPESFELSLLKPAAVDQVWPQLDRAMRTAEWELLESADPNVISLRYTLSNEKIANLEYTGPLTVTKRFRLPVVAEADIHKLASRTFHFNLELEINNAGDQSQTFAYELDGPSGSPTETWWYANKIHGRSTAIGYIAGARDVIGSNDLEKFQFFGCPEIVSGAMKPQPDLYYICSPLLKEPAGHVLNYAAVDTLYFNNALIPVVGPAAIAETGNNESAAPADPLDTTGPAPGKFTADSVVVYPNLGDEPSKNVKLQKLVDCTFQVYKTVKLGPGETYAQSFEIFSGPKEGDLLDLYGLDDARSFGWFAWFSKPLMGLLHFFYWITGSFSYGLAIIMLTMLVRSCMIPISRKAALNAQMMQHLQPQIKEISDKYKDDMEKRGVAQRELFKRHNYNPLSGCFMMFFQLPIFIGLYRGLSVDIALRDKPLIPGMGWCSNLSGPDQLLNWKEWMPAILGGETGWLGPYLNILPLVTMVLFIVQQKMFMPPATDDQQKMMQSMMKYMMIFMGVMFFKVAAGLCIYFITSSLWGIIERKLLPKPVLDTDKLALADHPDGTPVPLTKAQQKAEAKRELDLAERKLINAERKKRLRNRGGDGQ